MSPLSTNSISHFTHPAHKLNHHTTTNTPFLCDGCKVHGTGSRYTCTICDFDLHDYCAECPNWLTSTANHQHPMSLVVHRPLQDDQCNNCQICVNPIKGLAYVCKDCNFWVHPLCSVVSSNNDSRHQEQQQQQQRSVPSSKPTNSSAAQNVGAAVGIGLGTNFIYDAVKPDEGFFDSIKSGLKSLFESSLDK